MLRFLSESPLGIPKVETGGGVARIYSGCWEMLTFPDIFSGGDFLSDRTPIRRDASAFVLAGDSRGLMLPA